MNDTNQTSDMSDVNWQDDTTEARNPHGEEEGRETTHSDATISTLAEPIRPTGISWVTVVLGILCLMLAGIVLTLQWSDLRLAWTVATPAVVVGAGVLLLLAGAFGMVRGGKDEDLQLD